MEKAYLPAIVNTPHGKMAIMIPGINRKTVDTLDEHNVDVIIKNTDNEIPTLSFSGDTFGSYAQKSYFIEWDNNSVFDFVASMVR